MPTRVTRRVLAGRLLRDWQRAGGQGTRSPGTQVIFPHAFTITPWMSWSGSGGTNAPSRTANTNHASLGLINNTPAASGDYVTWNVEMAAGTWSLRFIHAKAADMGVHDVYINNTEVGSFDPYSAGTTFNNVTTISGVSVPTSGITTLKLIIDGKNASSSDFYYYLNAISGVKTA